MPQEATNEEAIRMLKEAFEYDNMVQATVEGQILTVEDIYRLKGNAEPLIAQFRLVRVK